MSGFFKEKSVGYWLMAGAFVCGLVALISYAAAGTNENVPSLSGSTLAGLIIFVVLAAAMLVYELRIVKYITAAVGLYSFLMFIVVQIPYETQMITTQFMGYSDVFNFTAGYFLVLIFSAIAFGLSMASAVMCGSGLDRQKKDKKKKAASFESTDEEADA